MAASADRRPKCQYWDGCYRKNPTHLAEFRHPADDLAAAASPAAPTAATATEPPPAAPVAKKPTPASRKRAAPEMATAAAAAAGADGDSNAMVDIPSAAASSSSCSADDRRVRPKSALSPAQSVHPHPFSRALSFLGTRDFLGAIATCKNWRDARRFKTAWPKVPDSEEECLRAAMVNPLFSQEPITRPARVTCRLLTFDLDSRVALEHILGLPTHPAWQHAMNIRCEWFAPARAADTKAEEKSDQCLAALAQLKHLTSLDLRDLAPSSAGATAAFRQMRMLRTVHLDLAPVVPILPALTGLRVLTLRLGRTTDDAEVAASLVQLLQLVELTLHGEESGAYEKDSQDRRFSLTHALAVRELSVTGDLRRFRLAGLATQVAFRGLVFRPRRATQNPPTCTDKGQAVAEKYFTMPPAQLTSLQRGGRNQWAQQMTGDFAGCLLHLPRLQEINTPWAVHAWMTPWEEHYQGDRQRAMVDEHNRDPLMHAFYDRAEGNSAASAPGDDMRRSVFHTTPPSESMHQATLARLTHLQTTFTFGRTEATLRLLSTMAPQLGHLHLSAANLHVGAWNGNPDAQGGGDGSPLDPLPICLGRFTRMRVLHLCDFPPATLGPDDDWSAFFTMQELEELSVPAPSAASGLSADQHLAGLARLPVFRHLTLREPPATVRLGETHLLAWATSVNRTWTNLTVWRGKFALAAQAGRILGSSRARLEAHQARHLRGVRLAVVTSARPPHPRKVYALVEQPTKYDLVADLAWEEELA